MYYKGDTELIKQLRDYGLDSLDLRGSRKDDDLNCSMPSILEFPNFMRKKTYHYPVLCLLMTIYLFIILAIVCDDYLVPAMERLCYVFRMTYDVAGATFLAVATSAPEMFVALVGTFITEGDIGIGTIVGSSVFNVLCIAAVCGLLTGVSAQLDWWPLTRDSLWYFIAIAMLTLVLIDSEVNAFEAGTFLVAYLIYLLLLIFDPKVQGLFRKKNPDEEEKASDRMDEDPLEREEEPMKTFKEHIDYKAPDDSNQCEKIYYYFKYPAALILAVTIVPVRTIYPLTMLLAIVWISIITYLVSWFLTVIGYNIGIPDSIMGLTILAAGTSVPEIVASYIVTRKGYGSMAMCNAIASNTFDVFICLGLPWMLKIILSGKVVEINSTGMTYTVAMLAITALLLYIAFLVSKFVLGKLVGALSFGAYIIFLIIACGLEFYLLKPVCDI